MRSDPVTGGSGERAREESWKGSVGEPQSL